MQIREATAADWDEIFPIFRSVVAAGDSYAYPDSLSSEEARTVWMEPPPSRVAVAVDGDRIVGTAKMGPNRPGRGSHVATASFMVDGSARGRGVGRALGEDALAWAEGAGYAAMQFNAVVETNEAAIALWTGLGFERLATVPRAFDHARFGRVGLCVMYRELGGDHAPRS